MSDTQDEERYKVGKSREMKAKEIWQWIIVACAILVLGLFLSFMLYYKMRKFWFFLTY